MRLPSASQICLHTKTNCWPGLYQTFHRKTSKVKQGSCARAGWGSLMISRKECYNGGGNPLSCSNLDISVKAQRVSAKACVVKGKNTALCFEYVTPDRVADLISIPEQLSYKLATAWSVLSTWIEWVINELLCEMYSMYMSIWDTSGCFLQGGLETYQNTIYYT